MVCCVWWNAGLGSVRVPRGVNCDGERRLIALGGWEKLGRTEQTLLRLFETAKATQCEVVRIRGVAFSAYLSVLIGSLNREGADTVRPYIPYIHRATCPRTTAKQKKEFPDI